MAAKQKSILYNGMGQPYLALFDFRGMPIMNPITGIPLGAYISTWNYRYDEEKENLATITFDTGDPDTVDVEALQENRDIFLQWGYIFSDGTFVSSPAINIKVRDFEAKFDSTGTHVTIKCIDSIGDLRYQPPYNFSEASENSLSSYLDGGCDNGVGVIIEIFQ
jgi:hypothetical protein